MPMEITIDRNPTFNKKAFEKKEIVFVCVGTDRSTGDSLGPLVGTYLEKLGYENVIGTIDDPCHAMNLQERLSEIPKGKTIIGIDSCLGQVSGVGKIQFNVGGLRPGVGVNKDLGSFGDYNILGVVNVGGFMEYYVLNNTRLSLVMNMAERIVSEIAYLFPVGKLQIASTREE